jgi:glycosyltransferase involved in cell wall biosynthesis
MFLKGLKIVADKTSKKIRAFIIGDGEERANIEQMASDLGLKFNNNDLKERNILTFTSWIKDIDVSNAGSDIIVLTSFNEGTPVSLIEAQASGKPIVSTRVGGIANVVKEGETALLCESDDVETFAAHLLRLIEDDRLRADMSDKGTAHVMENYSHLRLARDMGDLYRRLLNHK